MHQILIVGGGAGGLELAIRLGRRLGKRGKAGRSLSRMLLNLFLRLMYQAEGGDAPFPALRVAIVGAGATGVELSAELHHVADKIQGFGFDHLLQSKPVHITLIEAAPRILPLLPEKLAAAERQLKAIDVEIVASGRVQSVTEEAILLSSGQRLPAHLKVWAAGIKAPDFFKIWMDWRSTASISSWCRKT